MASNGVCLTLGFAWKNQQFSSSLSVLIEKDKTKCL